MFKSIRKPVSLLSWRLWAPPSVVAVLLVIIAQYNYLAFHTLAELFAIVISFLIFAVAWSTRDFARNNFLLFLACGYFWIGSLDLIHTLVYKGMDIFVLGSGNLSVQFWIGTRYAEALLLFAAPFAAARQQNGYLLVAGFGFVAAGLTTLIFSGRFPVGFVEGQGLTDFKIYSEYLIIAILASALIVLFRYGRDTLSADKALVAAAIVLTMCAELAFTFYVDVYGFSNLAGHILKLFSFWLIFEAIVVSLLREPYATLEESDRDYGNILHNMVDAFYRADQDGRVVMISPSVEDIGGYSSEEMIGRVLADHYVDRNKRAEFLQRLQDGNGEVSNFEAELKKKDGGTVWASTSARYWKDKDGKTLGVEGTIRNITANKQAEEALRHSQKMGAVGQLTGGIAHDYNNMLGVIVGNIQLVQGSGDLDDKSSQRLDKALAAAKRNAELTDKLLRVSSKQRRVTRPVSVNASINSLEDIISTSLTASFTIRSSLSDDLWLVDIDPAELEDAILNLAINARDAMPQGGILSFKTCNKVLVDDDVQHNQGGRAGEFVMISISDNGIGMEKDIRDQIFDPFFSTKEEGAGTGLGLSMVYAFIQRSGGFIRVFSEPGEGTTFHLFMPRMCEGEGPVEVSDEVPTPDCSRGAETVLVVDDEEALAELAATYLDQLGYRTFTANSGRAALEVLKAHPDIELLFSDIIMPGEMDGYSLARAAMNDYPSLKILLTSGFTSKRSEFESGEDKAIAKLAANLLSKPYDLSELAAAVRHSLNEKG